MAGLTGSHEFSGDCKALECAASEVGMGQTIWESMEKKGYNRRQFLQFCTAAAAAAGFAKSGVAQVVSAFEKKEKPAVVWMHFQECTCCSESFIRASHPIVADALLDVLSLNYTETLMAASGFQAEKSLSDTIKNNKGKYIVLVEGAVPTKDGGVYCMIGGKTAESILEEVSKDAAAIVAWGSCASNGCVQAAKPNPTHATPIHKLVNKPVINVPGCPPIADVMMAVVTHILVLGQIPALDSLGRPKEFYGRRVHDTCYRRPNYDAGLFVESFDDENARKGYCLYKMGCKGPVTYNACSVVGWNEGTSAPIRSGHPCIGCSEEGFWDNGPLYQHLASFPGFGIESTADTVGTIVAATTLAGVAAHAVVTNVRKHKVIAEVHAEEEKEQ
jgi:hydrogenase small subunit